MAEIFENKGSFVKKINGTNGGFSKNRRNSSRVLVRNEKRIEAFNKTQDMRRSESMLVNEIMNAE